MRIASFPCQKKRKQPQISLPQRTVEKARGAAIAPARTPQAQTASRLRHLPSLRHSPENNAWFVHREIRKRRVRSARRHISRLYHEKTLPWCSLCAQISLPQYTVEKACGAAIAPARTPQAQAVSRLRHLPTLRRAMENSAWFVHRKIRKRRVRPARQHTSRLYHEKTLPWCSLCAHFLPLFFMQRQIVLHRIPDPRQSIEHRPLPANNALNGAGTS